MFSIKVFLIKEILKFGYSSCESEKALSVKLFITAILYYKDSKESKCKYLPDNMVFQTYSDDWIKKEWGEKVLEIGRVFDGRSSPPNW